MFKFPDKYIASNIFQRQSALKVINEFKLKLKWGLKSNSSLLDIGCGPGDVTIDYVEPLLSRNYKRILGVDISEESINFAKKSYGDKYPKVKFEVMNIADKNLKIMEEFDYVASFYCLHFVQDQSQAIKNIYNMLKPDGDTIILLMVQFHLFWILNLIETNPRFKPHMIDTSHYLSPNQYSETPAEDFEAILKTAGFKTIICKTNRSSIICEKHQLEELLTIAELFKPGTSDDIRLEFKKSVFYIMNELELVKEESGKSIFRLPYKNVMAFAKKE